MALRLGIVRFRDVLQAVGADARRGGGVTRGGDARTKSLGVTIEAQYTVGEYDIKILSAEQRDGLETWLRENGYKPPRGASRVLASYIKQKMRFFVAQVNLEEQSKLGYTYLRPLQVAYESPKFMLPIRLGTLNAKDYQELFVFVLSKEGRVETTNYRTVKIPSNVDIPVYIKDQKLFADFYRAMFATSVDKENMRAVFLEYAWDMAWCDPCAADPLNRNELRELGVFWLDAGDRPGNQPVRRPSPAQNVYVTRLHLRYTADSFPEDLAFQQTGDRQNFQDATSCAMRGREMRTALRPKRIARSCLGGWKNARKTWHV